MSDRTTPQLASSRRFLTPALLLLLALLLRLPSITAPLLGVFATKSVVYGMIARNWIEGRAPIGRPTLDVLVDGQRSWHLVELPVQAYVSGGMWALFGGSLDVWGRVVSIALSLTAVATLYGLLDRLHGKTVATVGAALLAVAPVSIIYGQKYMLEPSVAALSLLTLYAARCWFDSWRVRWLVVMSLALALLLLTKFYMAVILLPVAVWGIGALRIARVDNANDSTSLRKLILGTFAISVATTPAILWYSWAHAVSAPTAGGEPPVFFSLRQSAATHPLPSPLLFDADFFAQLLRDLATVALTPIGFALFFVGLAHHGARQHWPWLLASLMLIVVMPRKFHEMNYYFLVILPSLCAIAALGWQLIQEKWQPGRMAIAGVIAIVFLPALRYSATASYFVPAEDRCVTAAAQAAQPYLTADEPVVTMHGSTIDLLYYCDRPGWAVAPHSDDLADRLVEYRRQGANVLVVAGLPWQTRHPQCRDLLASLEPLVVGDDYAVYRLPDAAVADAVPERPGRVSRSESPSRDR